MSGPHHQQWHPLTYANSCCRVCVRQLSEINISAVKIDVEGHETQVLRGMQQILNKYKPALLIEVIASQLLLHNNAVEDIYEQLYALGYQARYFNEDKKLVPVPNIHFEGYGIFFLQAGHLLNMVHFKF